MLLRISSSVYFYVEFPGLLSRFSCFLFSFPSLCLFVLLFGKFPDKKQRSVHVHYRCKHHRPNYITHTSNIFVSNIFICWWLNPRMQRVTCTYCLPTTTHPSIYARLSPLLFFICSHSTLYCIFIMFIIVIYVNCV